MPPHSILSTPTSPDSATNLLPTSSYFQSPRLPALPLSLTYQHSFSSLALKAQFLSSMLPISLTAYTFQTAERPTDGASPPLKRFLLPASVHCPLDQAALHILMPLPHHTDSTSISKVSQMLLLSLSPQWPYTF